MSARVGVVLFPGSNCEQDVVEAIDTLGGDATVLWHGDAGVGDVDAVVVPGDRHGQHHRLSCCVGEPEVTDQRLVENRVGGGAVVASAVELAGELRAFACLIHSAQRRGAAVRTRRRAASSSPGCVPRAAR